MIVDIIYGGDVNAPNGASVLIKKIGEAQKLFENHQVLQRIFSPSTINTSSDEGLTRHVAQVSSIKKIVKKISKYSLFVSLLRYYRNLIQPAGKAISSYEAMPDKGDIVVFHEVWTCYSYLKRNKENKAKVILTIHGDGDLWNGLYIDMPRFKSLLMSSYRKRLEKTIVTGCYKIGFDADLPRRNFCNTYKYDDTKSFFVYNGIEKRPYPDRSADSKLKIICVATLSRRKNQMGILNAVGKLDKECQQQIVITLVGDGPLRGVLEEKARELKAKVEFAGTMNEPQYYELMLKSNCFCLFSKEEGLPIAVIEGMRAGLPVIGSRVGGVPEEIEEGETGFVVELNDIDLYERIKWMLNHMELLPEMGHASYQLFLDRFTTEAMVRKYIEIYKS